MAVEQKRCPRCQESKDLAYFGVDNSRHDGRNKYCRACQRAIRVESYYRNPEKPRAYARNYRARWHLQKHYGISKEDFDALLEKQGGKCAICHREERLAVDHNHESGHVRGLLCWRCNVGLGFLAHFRANLDEVLAYLDS